MELKTAKEALPIGPKNLWCKNCKEAKITKKKAGVIPAVLFIILFTVSYPYGLLHELWKRALQSLRLSESEAITFWSYLWLAIILAVMFFAISQIPLWASVILIVLLAFRLFDIFSTFVRLLLLWSAPQSPGRALILLLVHYLEVVAIYACGYLFCQRIMISSLFNRFGKGIELTPIQAFHYSITVAYPFGGEITLNIETVNIMWVLWLEILCILAMVAIEIPRIIALSDYSKADPSS